jgi:Na+/melibiose symporter-like transporter
LFIPESRSAVAGPPDVVGVVLSSAGLLALTYGLIRAGENGWRETAVWVWLAVAAMLLAGFVGQQRRATYPLIDLGLFASRGFTWGTIFATTANFALFGLFFVVPQYFQAVLGVDALGSGLRLLPLIGGLVIGTRVAERVARHLGSGTVLSIGFALLTGGLVAGASTSAATGYGFTATWIAVVGAGMGCVLPTSMGAAMDELPVERAGSGSALIQALRQAGGTVGVAVLGTVLSTAYQSALGGLDVPPFKDGVMQGVGASVQLGRPDLVGTVQDAFVHGMCGMLLVSAAICATGAVLALTRMPLRRSVEPQGRGQSVHA